MLLFVCWPFGQARHQLVDPISRRRKNLLSSAGWAILSAVPTEQRACVSDNIRTCHERARRKRCGRQSQFLSWDFWQPRLLHRRRITPWPSGHGRLPLLSRPISSTVVRRSVNDLDVTFLRTRDGILLLLDS